MKVASNRIQDVYRHYLGELVELYETEEARNLIALIIDEYTGISKTEIFLRPGETINESELLKVHFAVKDLKRFRPVQQILGYTLFSGCRIGINEDVLIPRPETEEMVEKIKKENLPASARILDIGSGSGAIAIALKKHFPGGRVFALEKSEKAIQKASENADVNKTEIEFYHKDLFAKGIAADLPSDLDLIVSNPPYVRYSEKSLMRRNVLDYEPAEALFVPDNNALMFYARIAEIAETLISPPGILYLEINEALGKETSEIFSGSVFKVNLLKDLFGKDRFIRACKL